MTREEIRRNAGRKRVGGPLDSRVPPTSRGSQEVPRFEVFAEDRASLSFFFFFAVGINEVYSFLIYIVTERKKLVLGFDKTVLF